MEKNEPYYQRLLERYLKNDISAGEVTELFDFIKEQPEAGEKILRGSGNEDYINHISAQDLLDETSSRRMLDRLLDAITAEERSPKPVRRLINKWWYAAAAVFILLIGSGLLLFLNKTSHDKEIAASRPMQNDVAPGGNKAILILGNGRQIILDSARIGTLAEQGNASISKTDSGKLAYKSTVIDEGSSSIQYNTLSTPRGGQYQLQLPDGTKVWLNAASSIKYPTAFVGKERNVEMTGEAYFEVKHDASKPFHVLVNHINVKDVGTSFNINAYPDESGVKTTLIEGSVILVNAGTEITMQPGQQTKAVIGGITRENDPDIAEVLAWKNGRFYFDGADIRDIMRQAARWYDVDISYESIPKYTFVAKISRAVKISQLLNILELTDLVHFKIEGKKITVMK